MPNFNPNKSKIIQLFNIFYIALASALYLVGLLIILYYIFDTRAVFLGALIPEKYFSLPVRLLVVLFQSYLVIILTANIALVVGLLFPSAFFGSLLLTRELSTGRKFYSSVDSLRKPDILRKTYASFQIMHNHAMSFVGLYLVIMNAIYVMTALYVNFVLISYWTELKPVTKIPLLITTILITVGWATVLEFGCMFAVGSESVLKSWKRYNWSSANGEVNKMMRKFSKSRRPVLLCYGKEFVLGRLSVMNFFRVVVRGTFRALLAVK